MMKKNLLINLPEDVFITNILLSKVLPIKSLLSLKCVCKYLHNLITSPAFVNMQISKQNNNNNNPLVLIKATQRPDVFFSLKLNGGDSCRPEVVEFVSPMECPNIWGSCYGLVCLTERKNGKDTVCLWNPFTKEYKVVPPPLPSLILEIPMGRNATQVSLDLDGSITYGFGYDRILDDYKIVRCSEHFGGPQLDDNGNSHIPITEFQVYTLGTNTWRKISTDNNSYNSHFVHSLLMKNKSVVFVNGALHWIMSISDGYMESTDMPLEAKIVSFDIEKEVFQEIQTPLMAKFNPHVYFFPVIQVLRGCLCLLEHDFSTHTFCNVWMMIDYGVGRSWTKIFTILRAEVSPDMLLPSSYRLLRFCENGTVIMGSYNTILAYDVINNKARRVQFGEKIGNCMYQSEVYIESLVSLNSGVYNDEMGIQSKVKKVSKQGWKGSDSARLLGDMALHYMQKERYYMAEQFYSKALSIEPDKNKQCNLAICLMNSGRISEARSLLEEVVNPSFGEQGIADSYIESYIRAWKILTEL